MKIQSKSVQIPWGHGTTVPDEQLETEVLVRDLISDINYEANLHLNQRSSVDSYGIDKDPSTQSVLRTGRYDESKYLKVAGRPTECGTYSPRKFFKGKIGEGLHASATWNVMGIQKAKRLRHRGEAKEHWEQIQVNGNGTLTYTIYPSEKGC